MVTDQPTVAVERSGGRQQCVTHVHTLNHDSLFKLLLQWSLLELVLKTMLRQSQLFVTVITISVASIFILFSCQSSYDAFIPSLPALPQMHHLPRVLCWVNTHPGNHAKKAVHLAATWGRLDMKFIWRIPGNRWFVKVTFFWDTRRCDKLLFMSTVADERIGSIALPNITNGRASLWNKTKKVQWDIFYILPLSQAFVYVWEHHRDEADWFLKADDDTYVILENLKWERLCVLITAVFVLRDLLRNYNSEVPIQFGHRFKYMGVGHLCSLSL